MALGAAGLGGIGAIIAGTAVVKMIPDFGGFAEKAEAGLAGISSKIGSVGSTLTKRLTLPIIGFGAAAVAAFLDAQKVAAQTDAVLRSTGAAAGISAAGVDKLARSLAAKTAVDHVAIQSTENLLLTFTAIRNEAGKDNDIFNQATGIVLDMSEALGEDAKSAAIQLGKALQDPVRGITALRRVGVAFTEQQKDQIKTLVASGHQLEAQKIILAELRKEFGGSAEAFANTDAGKMKKAINELRDAGEKFGAVIAPALEAVARSVGRLAEFLDRLSPSARRWIVAILGIVAVVGPLLIAVSKIVKAFQIVKSAMEVLQLGELLTNPVFLVVAALALAAVLIIKNWGPISRFFERVWKDIVSIFDKAKDWIENAIGKVVGVLERFGARVYDVFDAIVRFVKAWWPLLLAPITLGMSIVVNVILKNWKSITRIVGDAIHLVYVVIKTVMGLILALWRLEWNVIVAVARAVWVVVGPIVRTGIAIVRDVIKATLAVIRAVWKVEWDAITAVARVVWGIIQAIVSAGVAVVRAILSPLEVAIRAIGSAFSWVASEVKSSVDWVIAEVQRLWNDISGPLSAIGHAIGGAFHYLLHGSPIPLVEDLKASTAALRKFSADSQQLKLPNVGLAMNVPAGGVGSRRAPAASASGGFGVAGGQKHFHLTVNTRESLGSIRRDFRLMEVMGQ